MKYDERFYNMSKDMVSLVNDYNDEVQELKGQVLEILFEKFSKQLEYEKTIGIDVIKKDSLFVSFYEENSEYQLINKLYRLKEYKVLEDDYCMQFSERLDVDLACNPHREYTVYWDYKKYFSSMKKIQEEREETKRLIKLKA